MKSGTKCLHLEAPGPVTGADSSHIRHLRIKPRKHIVPASLAGAKRGRYPTAWTRKPRPHLWSTDISLLFSQPFIERQSGKAMLLPLPQRAGHTAPWKVYLVFLLKSPHLGELKVGPYDNSKPNRWAKAIGKEAPGSTVEPRPSSPSPCNNGRLQNLEDALRTVQVSSK